MDNQTRKTKDSLEQIRISIQCIFQNLEELSEVNKEVYLRAKLTGAEKTIFERYLQAIEAEEIS